MQSTFLRAHAALRGGVRPALASAWLFTIARNVCRSRRLAALRRGRVETPRDLATMPEALLARGPNDADELVGLDEALAGMPPRLRRVLLLREWQGLSYRELAAELGATQPAVETLLFRARRELARRLRQPVRRVRDLVGLGPLAGLRALFRDTAAVKLSAVAASAAVVSAAAPGVVDRPVVRAPVIPHPGLVVEGPTPVRTVVRHVSAPAPPVSRPAPVAHVTVAPRRPESQSIEERRTQRYVEPSRAAPAPSRVPAVVTTPPETAPVARPPTRSDAPAQTSVDAAASPPPAAAPEPSRPRAAAPPPAASPLPAASVPPAPVATTVQSVAASAAAATAALPVPPSAPSVEVPPPPVDLPAPPVDVPAPPAVPDPAAVVSDAQSAASQVAPTVAPVPPPPLP